MVASGLLAYRFGADYVGQFNQLVMLHLVAGQLAAMGIHLSCLHYLSATSLDSSRRAHGARVALGAVTLIGTATGLVLAALAPVIERSFDSPDLADGIVWLGPAVALFGVNKTLLAILNACHRLHAYAVFQALRSVLWLAGIAVLLHMGSAKPAALGLVLCAGEVGVALFGFAALGRDLLVRTGFKGDERWFVRHLAFGWHALPGNLITELNTRIDVLVLAVFVSDRIVGVYSFVAMLAEGVFQIGVVVRAVVNRRLVEALAARDQQLIDTLKRRAGQATLCGTAAASLALIAVFPPAIALLNLDPALREGIIPLAILLIGVTACAACSPFWMSLVLAGRPTDHSRLMLLLCVSNLAANVVAVPVFGMLGAAVATAVMLATFPLMLRRTARRVLKIRL